MTVLFVILMITFFLGLDWVLHRRRAPAPAAAPAAVPVRLPRGVYFARSHTWLNLFPSGRAWLGIDDFVARLLERPRVRVLRAAGERVARGEPLLALEDGGRALTVRSPVDARIVAVNPELDAHQAGRGPLFDGWAVELEPERLSEVKALLLGEETAGWLAEELRRLRDLFALTAAPSPVSLQDGGAPAAGILKQLDADTWRRFEKEFLEVR